jgi:hypothetical protein
MAHKVTPRHPLAPLEDKLVFCGARNARGWWKPKRTRHNRLTAYAALHGQATTALAPPSRNHCTPAGRGHAGAESMGPLAPHVGRLIRSLHDYLLCILEVAPPRPCHCQRDAAAEFYGTITRSRPRTQPRPDTIHGSILYLLAACKIK